MGCPHESRLAADLENLLSKQDILPGNMLAAGFGEGVCRVFHIAARKLMCRAEILSEGTASRFSKPLSPTNLHYVALAC